MLAQAYDYIIVGAGSSGCVVASRLSEDPNIRVLLLEAGGRDNHLFLRMPMAFLMAMMNPRFNWGYMTEPEPTLNGRQLFLPRGRVLGGSSSINGMFYMRGHPVDYDEWAQMGCQGWTYEDVLPYFRKLESSWRGASRHHGDKGPIKVSPIRTEGLFHEELMDAGRTAGYPVSHDLSGDQPEGFSLGEATIDERGRRCSTAVAYLKPAMDRPNLTVVTGAKVSRVVFENKRAIAVESVIDGVSYRIAAHREIVLSGGTFNSPHLLMLSGVGPGDMLQKHGIPVVHANDHVGRNLSEHVTAPMEWDANGPISFLNQLRLDRMTRNALRWAVSGTGPMSSMVASANVAIRTRPELDRPDIQFMSAPIKLDAKPWLPFVGARQDHVFWAGVVLLHPRSRGHVALVSPDSDKLPAVHLNLLTDEADFASLRRGMQAARSVYRSGKQAALTGRERIPGQHVRTDEELDAYIRDTAYVAQHPVGTCSMGRGVGAVVDPELRVIGVDGLRVVDCSVMPTVPGANTNAPAIMVGEKASDMILGKTALARI